MIVEQSRNIIKEVGKVLIGKDDVIEKVLITIYAGGHILLEDVPGVGKTTLALGVSRALDLTYHRIQFTPDTMPSDITGFTMYRKETGDFEFREGVVNCNLLLGDEINRTSAKTQAALLEVMEEHAVTVDGVTHPVPRPFIVIATQNPVGSAGTQPLPDSQLDRFMVRLSVGYPSAESQVNILESHRYENPLESVKPVINQEDLLAVQNYLDSVTAVPEVVNYIIALCEATRTAPLVELGVSPRGIIALMRMARGCAIVRERDYVTPEDVREVFIDVCAHRLVLQPQARIEGVGAVDVLTKIMEEVPAPALGTL